jgi:hypothetical protein
MANRKEIENIRPDKSTEGLALMARKLGYRSRFGQLQFDNGASVSDLMEFFDDNPGAVEAVIEWVLDEGRDRDGNALEDGEEDDGHDPDESEEDEDD